MNYRHAFHAGNFADVLKHAVLIGLIDALKAKPSPFCYIDTHAGRGRYDLSGDEAQRTGEFHDGVGRLSGAAMLPPLLERYVAMTAASASDTLTEYPGSPLLAQRLLRDGDRAVLCELQPDEASALKQLLRDDPRCAVHQRDGYAALKAFLPPKERRGVVLIDPPFEAQDGEFRIIEKALNEAIQRWPTGIYAIWYPIKQRSAVQPFHRWLSQSGLNNVLVAELMIHPDHSPLRLNGCGMAIINAPWQFDRLLENALPVMAQKLATDDVVTWRNDWLIRN